VKPPIKNGKKRGKSTENYANAYTCIQMDANDADNDNVNVNDNDNDNVPDNVNVKVNEKENENAPAPKKSI